jgi:hypothetical protein
MKTSEQLSAEIDAACREARIKWDQATAEAKQREAEIADLRKQRSALNA